MTVRPSRDPADRPVEPSTEVGDAEASRTVTRDGLAVSTTVDGPRVTVTVAGELLQETTAVFADAVGGYADDPARSDVVVDLSVTSFMDSTGLGSLVTLHNQLVQRGATLRLVRPADRVFRLFELTRLDTLFEFVDPRPDQAARASR